MPPRGVGLWFLPTVDFCGATRAWGGLMVLPEEQKFTLRLHGTRRTLFLMKGSQVLYVGKTNSNPSLQQRTSSVLTPRKTGHGRWKAQGHQCYKGP